MTTCPICADEYDDSLGDCPRHDLANLRDSSAPEPSKDASDKLIGQVIRNRYRVNEVIGQGAMGVVYKATQISDGKDVAVKVLHTHLASDPESLKRFQHEAKAASSLMHPHIVRLYDVGVGPGGQPYIAMEFLAGETLSGYMRERRFLNTSDALPIIRQVCEALAEAHSHGVLHRDIKPANIMLLNRFGQENFVVVLDFSIAKVIQRVSDVDSTTPGLIFGSPAYMSPERFQGRGGDFRSDIYSMGIIMFQMLAGRAPFKSADLYTLMQEHVSTKPPRVKDIRPESDIPEELEQLIARSLSKRPEDRQENFKQLLADLDTVYRVTQAARAQAAEAQQQLLTSGTRPLSEVQVADADRTGSEAAKSTPVAGFNSVPGKASHDAAGNQSIFGIDPGLTPSAPISAFPGTRKQYDEAVVANASHKMPPDMVASGRWDSKNHVARTNSSSSLPTQANVDRPRQSIRPTEKERKFPVELMALTIVVLIGIAAVAFSLLPGDPLPTAIAHKISAGELDTARSMMSAWHGNLKATDEEKFAEVALNLGKAYYDRKSFDDAGACFAAVPEQSKHATEAHRYLAKLNRAPNSTVPSR